MTNLEVIRKAASRVGEMADRIETLEADLLNANLTISMQSEQADTDSILIQQLLGENARLREALKPLATIANLNGFPRGVDVTLWRRSTNEPGVEDITIKLSDCKKAYEALNANQ